MTTRTFTVTYKRTGFDDVRELKVLASNAGEARETAKETEGENIIIVRIR